MRLWYVLDKVIEYLTQYWLAQWVTADTKHEMHIKCWYSTDTELWTVQLKLNLSYTTLEVAKYCNWMKCYKVYKGNHFNIWLYISVFSPVCALVSVLL